MLGLVRCIMYTYAKNVSEIGYTPVFSLSLYPSVMWLPNYPIIQSASALTTLDVTNIDWKKVTSLPLQ